MENLKRSFEKKLHENGNGIGWALVVVVVFVVISDHISVNRVPVGQTAELACEVT